MELRSVQGGSSLLAFTFKLLHKQQLEISKLVKEYTVSDFSFDGPIHGEGARGNNSCLKMLPRELRACNLLLSAMERSRDR